MPDQTAQRHRIGLSPDLIDSIYTEALLLADEARGWFDRYRPSQPMLCDDIEGDPMVNWAARHDPTMRIALSCESLRLTTRLMHVIGWLLQQRALAAGEIDRIDFDDPANRLGPSPECDLVMLDELPGQVGQLVRSSLALHARVAALEAVQIDDGHDQPHPVHAMLNRLQSAV
jgi:regulator of CtrA degradation